MLSPSYFFLTLTRNFSCIWTCSLYCPPTYILADLDGITPHLPIASLCIPPISVMCYGLPLPQRHSLVPIQVCPGSSPSMAWPLPSSTCISTDLIQALNPVAPGPLNTPLSRFLSAASTYLTHSPFRKRNRWYCLCMLPASTH